MGNKKQIGRNVKGDMIQDSIVIKNTTYDNVVKPLKLGDFNAPIVEIETIMRVTGSFHPLFPYYMPNLKTIGDKLVFYSKPVCKEAMEKYPPRIKGTFAFSDKYKDFKNIDELLDYSYKTQIEIEIDKVEMTKMLGNIVDPFQDDIKFLLSKARAWKLKPQEFPKARPYKIVVEGSDISYDYVLLRVERIEDNRVFLSNKEQQSDTEFSVVLDLDNKTMVITIKPVEPESLNKRALLKFLKFTKYARAGQKVSVIALESDTFFAEGVLEASDFESGFDSIDKTIAILEHVIRIEEHYKISISIPEKLEEGDLDALFLLGEALKYGEVTGTWQNGTFDLQITEESKERIMKLKDKPVDLSWIGARTVRVFNKEFQIPKVIITLMNAYIEDLERVKRKISVMEDGDSIKLTFVPKEDNQYVERFCFGQSVQNDGS